MSLVARGMPALQRVAEELYNELGLEGLVRSAAEELSPFKIRVNAVRPGLTRSKATRALFANPDLYQRFAAEKPLERQREAR